jgi:hypothetical protein
VVFRALAVAALGVVISACGGGASAATPPTLPFNMTAQNARGVTGSGHVVTELGSFTVTIRLSGLAPLSSHASHVHIGSCANPGGIAYALLQVIADKHGDVTATTRVAEDYSLPRTGWYVNVHLGPNLDESEYAPSVSCGDLPVA